MPNFLEIIVLVPFAIDDLLLGAALDNALGGAVSARRFLRARPPQRLLLLLHKDFGTQADAGRDEFYAFVKDSELDELISGLLAGSIQPDDSFVKRFADRLVPRLHRVEQDRRRPLATDIAIGAIRAYPLAIREWTDFGPLVVHKLDLQFGQQMDRLSAVEDALNLLIHSRPKTVAQGQGGDLPERSYADTLSPSLGVGDVLRAVPFVDASRGEAVQAFVADGTPPGTALLLARWSYAIVLTTVHGYALLAPIATADVAGDRHAFELVAETGRTTPEWVRLPRTESEWQAPAIALLFMTQTLPSAWLEERRALSLTNEAREIFRKRVELAFVADGHR